MTKFKVGDYVLINNTGSILFDGKIGVIKQIKNHDKYHIGIKIETATSALYWFADEDLEKCDKPCDD